MSQCQQSFFSFLWVQREQLVIVFRFVLGAVILACRSRERGEAVKQRIEGEAEAEGRRAPEVEVAELDVGSLRSVKGFAERLRAQGEELDALVNNAGVFAMGKRRQETEEGVELHWATNYLGPAALTLRLLPSIKRGGRVVFVSSRLEQLGKVRPSDPQFRQKGSYSSFAAYCQSKLVEELFANELASRVGSAQRLLTLTVHPGSVATSVVRDLPAFIKHAYYRFVSRILLTPSEGARAPLHCATSEEVGLACDDMGRGSFESSGDPVPLRSEARDPALSRRVWDMLLGQAKLDDPLPLFPEKG